MRQTVEFRDWRPDAAVREFVHTRIGKLDRLLKSVPADATHLRVVVGRKRTRRLYRVSISLDLPGPNLAAEAERHDLKETVHDAVAEIRRQLEKQRRKRTHTGPYKRPTRRARI